MSKYSRTKIKSKFIALRDELWFVDELGPSIHEVECDVLDVVMAIHGDPDLSYERLAMKGHSEFVWRSNAH